MTPLVKICGITRVDDAKFCRRAGVAYLGLNFYPRSPRFLTDDQAEAIVGSLDDRTNIVALFVNASDERLDEVASFLPDSATFQFHGDESPEDLARFRDRHPGRPIFRAFRLKDRSSVAAMGDYLEVARTLGASPDAALIDAFDDSARGGTGRTIHPSLLSSIACDKLILAGGLTAENLAERIRAVRPWMIDVASGAESSPGIKDRAMVERIVRVVDLAAKS